MLVGRGPGVPPRLSFEQWALPMPMPIPAAHKDHLGAKVALCTVGKGNLVSTCNL